MKRVTPGLVLMAIAALATLPLRAQNEQSLTDELLSVYRNRSKKEVETLAKKLDAADTAVKRAMPKDAVQAVTGAVDLAWQSAPESIVVFRALVESPRKFTRWAAKEPLPAWFNVPDSIAQIRRWEGLRPLLAPFATGDRLGWDLLDNQPWSDQPGAWRHELALLLRWLDRKPDGIPDDVRKEAAAWASVQSGRDFIAGWRAGKGEKLSALHGQYKYVVLPPPRLKSGMPPRLRALLNRIIWTGSGDPGGILPEKEALLADLSAEMDGSAIPLPATAEWFDTAARSFPPFSAFKPESTGTPPGIRAFQERTGRTANLVAHLREAGPENPAFRSVLWHQSTMTREGKVVLPLTAWSSWVPEPVVNNPPPAVTATPQTGTPAEGVLDGMCVWMACILHERAGGRPVRLTVAKPVGWVLAFRPEELYAVAERNKVPLGSGKEPGAVQATLSVVRVDPDRSVTAELRLDGKPVAIREFLVPGPWPPWVASRRFPRVTGTSGVAAGMAFAAFACWVWWLFRLRVNDDRQVVWVSSMAAGILGMALAAALMLWGINPEESPERQGVIEMSLPLNGGAPPNLRKIVSTITVEVYERLSRQTAQERRSMNAMKFRERWLYAARRMRFAPAKPEVAVQSDAITRLAYRILPSVFGRAAPVSEGPIESGGVPAFKELLESLEYSGEPDVPSALIRGPSAGARLALVVFDGDHGGVSAPLVPPAAGPLGNILTVELESPTRDARRPHGLLSHDRGHWIEQRSARTLALQAGKQQSLAAALPTPTHPADSYAATPTDLDAGRAEWWHDELAKPRAIDAAAKEVAELASEMLTHSGVAPVFGSHTILRARFSLLTTSLLWLALIFVAMAYHLSAAGATWQFPRVVMKLILETILVIGIAVASVLPALDAWLSRIAWTFGENLLDGIADTRTGILVVVVFAVIVRVVLSIETSAAPWRQEPHYVFSLTRWLVGAGGSLALALALTCWISAPAPIGSGSWLPPDYPADLMAGLGFWFAGIVLLTFKPKNSNAPLSPSTNY